MTRLNFALFLTLMSVVAVGCNNGDSPTNSRQFVMLGTAPVGGAFNQVGNSIATVVESNKGELNWKVQSQATKGSKENIRSLDKGEIQLGMSNSAISYHAVRGSGSWDKEYQIRAVATLAPNVGLFITKQSSGIKTMADLKGKRVTVGPAGAGMEMFLSPLLQEHGVIFSVDGEDDQITPLNQNYSGSVQLLGDDDADAAFVGGAIPTAAVSQACASHDIHFVTYDDAAKARLIEKYDFFSPVKIPAMKNDKKTYEDLEGDFSGLNVGSMQLITHANVDEDLVYELTKKIWENRKAIAKQHPAGNAINEKNAARYTGTEFHPGAVRFYQEIGIWPAGDSAAAGSTAKEPAAAGAAE